MLIILKNKLLLACCILPTDIEAQIMELYDQKPGAPAPGAANTAPAITAATAAPHAAPSANGQHSAASRPGVPGPAASSATQPTAAASVAAVSMAAVSCSAAGPRDSPEEGELPSSSQQQQQPAGVSAVVGHSNGAAHALPRAEGSGRYDNAQHEACSAHQAIANGSSAAAHANGHHANGHSSGHCSAEAEKPGADADASVLLTGKKRKFEDEGDGCNHMGAERKRLESEGVCAATAVTAQ